MGLIHGKTGKEKFFYSALLISKASTVVTKMKLNQKES